MVNIPPLVLRESGLGYNENEELEVIAEKGKIVLKKKDKKSK